MTSPWPMAASPVVDGTAANALRWYQKLFKPINDEDAKLIADDSGWLAPALLNSWVNNGGGWGVAGYRKRRNIVFIRGLIKSGTVATIFILPIGFQPNENRIFTTCANGGAARIDITPAGLVAVTGYGYSGGNGFVSLGGIAFLAEQ